MSPRIALIVDNPFRDLPALVLVATKLCKMGASCYLVPFNLYQKELSYLLPDFVLFQYIRENNELFIKKLQSLGIKTGVLDTEGIFNEVPAHTNNLLKDGTYTGTNPAYNEFFIIMGKDSEARNQIDCYCAWNEDFANYLKESKWFNAESVFCTGSPRTDLFHSKWKELSLSIAPYLKTIEKPMVLINSSFPMVSPQFQTAEEEIKMMAERFHYDEEYMRNWVKVEREARDLFIELTNILAAEFPSVNFVYRPHPFESEAFYKDRLLKLSNLHVIRKGTLDAWLHHAAALIHYRQCTTSIEAGLANIPVLTADWLPLLKYMPQLDNISLSVPDLQAMKSYIKEIAKGGTLSNTENHDTIQSLKKKLYYQVDGFASERVAKAILASCTKSSKKLNLSKAKADLNSNALGPQSKLLAGLRERMNISIHWSFSQLKYIYHKQLAWDTNPKAFKPSDVANMVQCIQQYSSDNKNITVRLAKPNKDYYLGYREGRSVVIENK